MNASRLLLLNDKPRALMTLARELRAQGCTVLGPYLGAATALDVLGAGTVHATIIDMQKPGGNDMPSLFSALALREKPFVVLSDLPASAISPELRDHQLLGRDCSIGEIFTALHAYHSRPQRWSRWDCLLGR